MTILVDLIKAVAVGMSMTGMVFMKRMTDLQHASISVYHDPDERAHLEDEECTILNESAGRILLIHFGSPMSFGAAKGMARELSTITDFRVLVLDLSDMPQIDFTATRSLYDIVRGVHDGRRQMIRAGGRQEVMAFLVKQGVVDLASRTCEGSLQPDRSAALEQARTLIANIPTRA